MEWLKDNIKIGTFKPVWWTNAFDDRILWLGVSLNVLVTLNTTQNVLRAFRCGWNGWMFLENVVLGKVCALQVEEVTGVWRKQRNEKLLGLCSFVTIIRRMKYRRMLARSQYPEGPTIGHLGTGFSWFPSVYKRMLRWFPRLQVATTCFSCSPPDLNFLDP